MVGVGSTFCGNLSTLIGCSAPSLTTATFIGTSNLDHLCIVFHCHELIKTAKLSIIRLLKLMSSIFMPSKEN